MTKFYYFKVTFIATTAGIFAGMLVYGLFDVDFSNSKALTDLVLKSFLTAITGGLVLGIINMFFKLDAHGNKKK